jgi:hypothetical protein
MINMEELKAAPEVEIQRRATKGADIGIVVLYSKAIIDKLSFINLKDSYGPM